MKNNIKNIINYINKYANDGDGEVPQPPKDYAKTAPVAVPATSADVPAPAPPPNIDTFYNSLPPETPAPAAPKTHPKTSPVVTNKDVQQMQLWVQKFVDVVLSAGDVTAKQFNNYLTEKYVANTPNDVSVKEYDVDPNVKTMPDKQRTESNAVERDNLLDSVHRLGNIKAESKPDGNWGPRTNNALLGIYAIAYALYNLHIRLGEQNNFGFEQTDLKTFDDNLIKSQEELKASTIAEKQERAKNIIPVLKKLITFYKGFSKSVLQSPVYSKYINGESMFTVKSTKTDPSQRTPEEESLLQKADQLFIGELNLTNKSGKLQSIPGISLKVLTSAQSFIQLGLSLGFTLDELNSNPDIKKRMLNEIMTHVNNVIRVLSKPRPQVQEPKKENFWDRAAK